MPVRILWFSNAPWATTGYATQTATFAPRLAAAGHDVAIAAFYGLHGSALQWEGLTVYPGSPEDPWAQDVLPGHYGRHDADLLITLMDAWVMSPQALKGLKVAHWLPSDCSPLSVLDRRILSEGGGVPIAMTRFGQQQARDAGFEALYVPHGVDCGAWQPLPDRDAIREEIGIAGRFLIGINAANADPVRKGFGEQMDAFARFRERHPEAILLIHSRAQTQQGADLFRLAESLGLGEDSVKFADQYLIAAGLTKHDELARWYGLLDVLSHCSYGEGFGLAALEAQACGTPVVTTDFGAMAELCGPGWTVQGQRWFNKGHGAWWMRPDVDAICAAYEQAYEHAAGRREKAREFALGYDADRVMTEHWKPVLDEMAEA